MKILVLEITSKKIFLIFFLLGTIPQSSKQLSNYFFGKFSSLVFFCKLSNEVSQSNIFIVFFLYILSSKVNNIFIILGLAFCSVNLISINSYLLHHFPLSYCYYIWLKFYNWKTSCQNFNGIYRKLCVLTAFLQNQTILMWLQSPKLIYELFLIYS